LLDVKKEEFDGVIKALSEKWYEYANEKGWKEKELRNAIEFLKREIDEFMGFDLLFDDRYTYCLPVSEIEYVELFTPENYENVIKVKELGVDKTRTIVYLLPKDWDVLIEMAESGLTPDEIDLLMNIDWSEEYEYVYWYEEDFKETPYGWDYESDSFCGQVIDDAIVELEKEGVLTREEVKRIIEYFHRSSPEVFDEIAKKVEEIKKAEWRNRGVFYCRKEDVPKVKEKLKELIVTFLIDREEGKMPSR